MSEHNDGSRPDDHALEPSPPGTAGNVQNLQHFAAGTPPQDGTIEPPTPRVLMGVSPNNESIPMPFLGPAPTILPLPDTAAAVDAVAATLAQRSPSPA